MRSFALLRMTFCNRSFASLRMTLSALIRIFLQGVVQILPAYIGSARRQRFIPSPFPVASLPVFIYLKLFHSQFAYPGPADRLAPFSAAASDMSYSEQEHQQKEQNRTDNYRCNIGNIVL